jgi:hypothetical protein
MDARKTREAAQVRRSGLIRHDRDRDSARSRHRLKTPPGNGHDQEARPGPVKAAAGQEWPGRPGCGQAAAGRAGLRRRWSRPCRRPRRALAAAARRPAHRVATDFCVTGINAEGILGRAVTEYGVTDGGRGLPRMRPGKQPDWRVRRAVPYGTLCHPALKERGPSMYEMEGPRLASRPWLAGGPAAVRHEAATGRVPRRRLPGFPGPAAAGVASGMSTSSVVK